jgi:hypothetical protein
MPFGTMLAPGFIDLQVNGGGGILFNDEPTPDAMRVPFQQRIAAILPLSDSEFLHGTAGDSTWKIGGASNILWVRLRSKLGLVGRNSRRFAR